MSRGFLEDKPKEVEVSYIAGHTTFDDDDPSRPIAYIHPASRKSIELVLSADETSEDGRSNFVWVRLPNGDLILGVFPQGDTYLAVDDDSDYWSKVPTAPA